MKKQDQPVLWSTSVHDVDPPKPVKNPTRDGTTPTRPTRDPARIKRTRKAITR